MNFNKNQLSNFIKILQDNNQIISNVFSNNSYNEIYMFKKGNKIKIKKQNRGKFTEYCGGNVTAECIQRGKNSPDPKIRKRATFAANSRKWNK